MKNSRCIKYTTGKYTGYIEAHILNTLNTLNANSLNTKH